jgi:RsiW-degrading membrane proteinase PrsW (M82 family)
MILIAMIVTAMLFFIAGMHYATWDQNRDIPDSIRSVWWSIALCLVGVWNMISLVGMASKV